MLTGLERSWYEQLQEELQKPYFEVLSQTITLLYETEVIYPPQSDLLTAFNATPFDKVKVVILGQDPYHSEGQAHGLAFSVRDGVVVPASLRNIFKEIRNDIGMPSSITTGDLTPWATQGVLLLNTTLTVRAGAAGSHRELGWETFTDAIISLLSSRRENIVFLLWGKWAQKKSSLIDPTKHYVLQAPHPSPLSAHRGFFGCRHFSQCNQYLKQHNLTPITW